MTPREVELTIEAHYELVEKKWLRMVGHLLAQMHNTAGKVSKRDVRGSDFFPEAFVPWVEMRED